MPMGRGVGAEEKEVSLQGQDGLHWPCLQEVGGTGPVGTRGLSVCSGGTERAL